MNKDTFCIMAHKGFFVEPTKHVKPCCVFKDFETPVLYDENKSFDEVYNSEQFKDLRNKMDNGIVHKGCEDCFNGRINYREGMNYMFFQNDFELLENMNINKDYTSDEILYLDLRLSNLCNFKCRMCNSSYSSSWADELDTLKIGHQKISKIKTNWIQPIENQIDKIKFLYLAGGEPFIMSETFELLDRIKDRKSEIRLFVNTNLSNLKYKSTDILDEIMGFDRINFFVSCDGFGDVGEYQRTGFNTDKFKSNLRELLLRIRGVEKIELSMIYALSAINVFHVFDYLKILKDEFDLSDDVINFQFVNSPWYYSVASGDGTFKSEVIEFITKNMEPCGDKLKAQLNNFITFIKTNNKDVDINQSKKDYSFIQKIDTFRKTDMSKVSPWIEKNIINGI
jgi:MoaA/NifB/PqqE/SkfB family radical SAM enzyme